MFCAGGYIPDSSFDKVTQRYSLPIVTIYIKQKFAPFLMKTGMKCTVIVLYCIYLGFSVWGCYALREEKGFKLKNLALTSSYLIPYYNYEEKYFRQKYGPRVMIAVAEPLDYSSHTVREELSLQLDTFRNSSLYFSDESYTESWLTSFLMYLKLTGQNPEDMTSFIDILRSQFLTTPPFDIFALDVSFNDNFTQIVASRLLLQGKGVEEDINGEKIMTVSREIADKAKFNITTYHPVFIFLDQLTIIYSNTFQNLAIAVMSMLLVSTVLLPSVTSVICVTTSVISICTGVLGFMVLWDVGLDSISMINLIICIGFSVDFSAHISYHFAVSEAPNGNARAIEALGHIGTPILQGALSTILAVLVLASSQSYIFTTFFKIMFLVMVFGFGHAMFLLPTVLSLTARNRNDLSVVDKSKDSGFYEPVSQQGKPQQHFDTEMNIVSVNGINDHKDHKDNGTLDMKENGILENKNMLSNDLPEGSDKRTVEEDQVSLYDNV